MEQTVDFAPFRCLRASRPLTSPPVVRDGSIQDVADLRPQLGRLQHLHVVPPRQDPQPDLDDPTHGGAPEQRTVRAPIGLLQRVPNRFKNAIGHGGRELQNDVGRWLVGDDVPAPPQVALQGRPLRGLERARAASERAGLYGCFPSSRLTRFHSRCLTFNLPDLTPSFPSTFKPHHATRATHQGARESVSTPRVAASACERSRSSVAAGRHDRSSGNCAANLSPRLRIQLAPSMSGMQHNCCRSNIEERHGLHLHADASRSDRPELS